jgi:predicted MPP superfamily phosphohydrolase
LNSPVITTAPSSLSKVDIGRNRQDSFLISQLDINIEGLPKSLENFTIVHLSDIHFGELATAELINEMVKSANSFKPDIIALTGDFLLTSRVGLKHHLATTVNPKVFDFVGYRRRARQHVKELSPLLEDLRAKESIYAIAGNHEHIDGFRTIRKTLPNSFNWLTNDTVSLQKDDFSLIISGIDDIKRGKPDSARIRESLINLKQTNSNPSFNILLCHNPDIVISEHKDLLDNFQLMLSGHTHGGQICLPIVGPLLTNTHQRKHIRGLSQHQNTHIYVSNGIGFGFMKLRLLCPPEIGVFRLRRA